MDDEVVANLVRANEALKKALSGDVQDAIAGALSAGEEYGRVAERNRWLRVLEEAWRLSRPITEVRSYLAEQLGPDVVARLRREEYMEGRTP